MTPTDRELLAQREELDREYERMIRQQIDMLQREYEKRIRPLVEELVRIESRKSPQTILLALDAEDMGRAITPAAGERNGQ